jgi:hypothetical protein
MAWLLQPILENSVVIIFVGLVTLAILFGGLVQTGKRVFIVLIIAAAVLFAGLVVLEQTVVTHRERVTSAIHEIARALEAGDVAAVERRISKTAPQIKDDAHRYLRLYRIDRVKVKRNLQVQPHLQREPPQATAQFNAVFYGADRAGRFEAGTPLAKRFIIQFVLEDDLWRIYKYEMLEPLSKSR